MKKMRSSGLHPAFALAALASAPAASPAADPAPRVFALVVADTDSNIGESVRIDGENVARLLRDGFATRPHRLELETFDGAAASRDAILAYYEDLAGKVRGRDTLLFYYSGHGAAFAGRGHCLTMSSDRSGRHLARRELVGAMQGLSPRLSVVLTDCCSKMTREARGRDHEPLPRATWPAMDFLFFHHAGIADVNGCQEDAFSWCYRDDEGIDRGSTFTLALAPLLCTRKDRFGEVFGTEGGALTWELFAARLRRDTDAWYQRIKQPAQDEQVPQVFSLPRLAPQEIADKIWMLGVDHAVVPKDGSRVVVIRVYPDTPAARAGLREGDVLSRANGERVRSSADFNRICEHSDGRLDLTYFRDGAARDCSVELVRVKPKP